VSPIEKEEEKGGAPQGGKSAPRRKKTEENRGRKGSAPYKGKGAARVEKDPSGEIKDMSRSILRERHPRGGATIRAGVDDKRSSGLVLSLREVQRTGMSHRGQ